MVSTLFVNPQLFPKATTKQVRFIQSNSTNKWYIPIADMAMLLGSSAPRFSKHASCYHWNIDVDGDKQVLNSSKQPVSLYVEAATAALNFLSKEQAIEFKPWISGEVPVADETRSKKRVRQKTRFADEPPLPRELKRAAAEAPPLFDAAEAAAKIAAEKYVQIVREWFAENEHELREQAIARLMQKEELRESAIERIARELVLAARPKVSDVIGKFF